MRKSDELENIKLEILDDFEIDLYLQDVMNVDKEIECIECKKWPEDIRKKM